MKYNLAKYSQTVSNTVEGDIDLTSGEIINIINSTIAQVPVPVSGTSGGTLVLDCDLGARVHIGEVQYYFDSVLPTSTAASGIKFYYKNEDFEVYVGLSTYYNENYYYTIVSGTSAPRYIRVEHTTVSGLGGYVNSLRILNDDTYVDFGEDGTDTNTNFNLSIENTIIEINDLEIFNSGPVKANAKLLIEPQNTIADDILSISDSVDGPWYGVYRDADKITGMDLWETGAMDNTQITSDVLKLQGGSSVGTYTTRIIKLEEDQRLTFNVMDYSYAPVLPSIEFFDDFSQADANWTVTSIYRYDVDFTAGNIDAWNTTGIDAYLNLQTKILTYEYGDDWNLTFTYTYSHYMNYSGMGQWTYFMWPLSNFYFRNYGYNEGTLNVVIVLEGTVYSLIGLYDWWGNRNILHNIRVQRKFTTVRFKIWKVGDSEPVDWLWEVALAPGFAVLPETGGIKLRIEDGYTAYHSYYDNFELIKNYSADVSAKSIIAVEDIDTKENIEVRSSNSDPMPRESYIWMSGTYSPAYKYTNHNWIADGSVEEQSNDWGTWGQTSNYWEYWYDSISENEYIIDKPFYTGTGGNTAVYFRIRKKSGALYSTTITNNSYTVDCFYSTYKVLPVSTGGFWINFFLGRGNINDGIYYLRYYNSTVGQMYNRQANSAQGTFMYDMDVVYDTGHLWYTDRDISTVFKINTDGAVLTSYLATQDIRGIVALADGGCWFIQQEALVRLDTNGGVVGNIELPTSVASYIYNDLYGGFWLQEGETLYHLAADGKVYFSILIRGLLNVIVMDSGLLVKHHDGSVTTPPKASYISKDHRRIVRTWDYPQNEGGFVGTFDTNKYGARSQTYDDLVDDHASHFPIATDNGWDSSEWTAVSLRDYNFTNEQYHQIRLTLRADNSANSPEVYGLWAQRAIEIPNIYPSNYGKFYLKSDVTYLAPQDVRDYTSKIRAYWLLNTE